VKSSVVRAELTTGPRKRKKEEKKRREKIVFSTVTRVRKSKEFAALA